jgi:hypothetical protein
MIGHGLHIVGFSYLGIGFSLKSADIMDRQWWVKGLRTMIADWH